MQQPPSDKGKRLKLYYITQVAVKPPTFVIFVNDKELMHFSYTRYLENKIREQAFDSGELFEVLYQRKKGKGSVELWNGSFVWQSDMSVDFCRVGIWLENYII